MKDKFKDIVSKKLNELKDEDQELDKEVEKLLKDSEEGRNKDKLIIIPFLKKLDELINEEYKKHNVPNDYVSRGIKIITNKTFTKTLVPLKLLTTFCILLLL